MMSFPFFILSRLLQEINEVFEVDLSFAKPIDVSTGSPIYFLLLLSTKPSCSITEGHASPPPEWKMQQMKFLLLW